MISDLHVLQGYELDRAVASRHKVDVDAKGSSPPHIARQYAVPQDVPAAVGAERSAPAAGCNRGGSVSAASKEITLATLATQHTLKLGALGNRMARTTIHCFGARTEFWLKAGVGRVQITRAQKCGGVFLDFPTGSLRRLRRNPWESQPQPDTISKHKHPGQAASAPMTCRSCEAGTLEFSTHHRVAAQLTNLKAQHNPTLMHQVAHLP
jgi:hypothetical protein